MYCSATAAMNSSIDIENDEFCGTAGPAFNAVAEFADRTNLYGDALHAKPLSEIPPGRCRRHLIVSSKSQVIATREISFQPQNPCKNRTSEVHELQNIGWIQI